MRNCSPTALFATAVALMTSCGADSVLSPQYGPPSREVRQFIGSQSLPLFRYSERLYMLGAVEVFRAVYGHPYDCPAGCAYSSALGLRRDSKIGWMKFSDAEGYEPDSTRFFDVATADSVLFETSLWTRAQESAASVGWFWPAFLPLLAHDEDTPPGALLRIAHMLYSYISPHVARMLLENPTVQHNRDILLVLAALPVFQGDAYELPRARAADLLELLD